MGKGRWKGMVDDRGQLELGPAPTCLSPSATQDSKSKKVMKNEGRDKACKERKKKREQPKDGCD